MLGANISMRQPPERNDYKTDSHYESALRQWTTDAVWTLVICEAKRNGKCELHGRRIFKNTVAVAVICAVPVIVGGAYAVFQALQHLLVK